MSEIGYRMEALLGFIAPIFFLSMLMIAISLSPGYSPLTHTISELAYFPAKTLFSIAFITYGTLAIPFAIKLEREFVDISEKTRRVAITVALFSSLCISFIAVIPDENSYALFILFHGFSALIAFGGSSIYIVLYCFLMYKSTKIPPAEGNKFKRITKKK